MRLVVTWRGLKGELADVLNTGVQKTPERLADKVATPVIDLYRLRFKVDDGILVEVNNVAAIEFEVTEERGEYEVVYKERE